MWFSDDSRKDNYKISIEFQHLHQNKQIKSQFRYQTINITAKSAFFYSVAFYPPSFMFYRFFFLLQLPTINYYSRSMCMLDLYCFRPFQISCVDWIVNANKFQSFFHKVYFSYFPHSSEFFSRIFFSTAHNDSLALKHIKKHKNVCK